MGYDSTMGDEVLLAFPESIRPIAHVRSTLLLGAIDSLRDAGHGDAYFAALSPSLREAIATMVAGMWIPIDVAHAHYAACDTLGIPGEAATQIGRGTFAHTKGVLLGAAVGLARGVGVNPCTLAPHFQRFWLRGNDGGAIRAILKGPKEMQVDVVECPLLRSRYYRGALRGVFTGVMELVAQKVYMQERRTPHSDTAIAYRVQWV
jgi:hypothetical protein